MVSERVGVVVRMFVVVGAKGESDSAPVHVSVVGRRRILWVVLGRECERVPGHYKKFKAW